MVAKKKFGVLWILAIAAMILVGCDEETIQSGGNDTTKDEQTETVAESTEPRVYWIEDTGDRLELVAEPMPETKANKAETLDQLLTKLTEGNVEGDRITALPENTKIISHDIQDKGIVINLSEAFTSGGGSSSMISRLGQVLYTATSFDPKANVWFEVEGEPLELLSGEGLEVAQPMTRTIFEQEFQL